MSNKTRTRRGIGLQVLDHQYNEDFDDIISRLVGLPAVRSVNAGFGRTFRSRHPRKPEVSFMMRDKRGLEVVLFGKLSQQRFFIYLVPQDQMPWWAAVRQVCRVLGTKIPRHRD